MKIEFSPHFTKQDLSEVEFKKLIQAIEVHGYRGS